ncbi:MAG: Hsp70 family protein [Oscillospiraceae bacterium]|nr:Hsp70 family protein [Oscillospiraceae bacterium]
MDIFYGFDLGDAESAIAKLDRTKDTAPEILTIQEAKSFITAYALSKDGKLIIGEGACYEPQATTRKLRFKSRFLTSSDAARDIRSFAGGVLGELYLNGDLIRGEDHCFYIGCPAGWGKGTREEYREIFQEVGYPPAKIISESRAALVSACQSKHLQVGYDILSRPVLVIDIGSSTTDFAYITSGKEEELQTGGEVFLGGGIMDEILLEESVSAALDEKRIRKIFSESEAWRTYCEFAARRLKEKYFSDEEFWEQNECVSSVTIRYSMIPAKLTLRMNPEIADRLLNKKVDKLDGRSFREVFTDSLVQVRDSIKDKQPELIFLTGGVSRLPAIRDWCSDVFPDAVVIRGAEPEFSVASGLALCGKIDEELREFKSELEDLKASSVVEDIVQTHITELYHSTVEALVDPILKEVVRPVVERWRTGSIEKLSDIDPVLQNEIEVYLHTDDARAILAKQVSSWLKNISSELEEHTMPICVRHNVPYSALSLNSYLSLSDLDVKVEAKDLFAVSEITWMIDTIVSILIGLLCGGSGIAVIAGGPEGIIAGIIVSLLVLALGQETMQNALLNANLPKIARHLVPKGSIDARMEKLSEEIKAKLYDDLEKEKNDEITERLVKEISEQIEVCLTKMAEVVEIPLS